MNFVFWLLIGLCIFCLLVFIIGSLLAAPKYQGPITDHFDGKNFINYGGVKAKGFENIFKYFIKRKPTKWVIPKDVVTKATVTNKVIDPNFRVTFINHATILIQLKGVNIITDPVYSRAAGLFGMIGPLRKLPPGIELEDLPPIDFVFISHNHYDHLDIGAIKKIAKQHHPKFITTLGNDLLLKKYTSKLQAIDWWQSIELTNEIELICTPGQHFSSRGLTDRDANLWGGFVLKTKTGNIYWAGDSGYGNFFKDIGKKYGPFRFACIPIGAYKPRWFMSPIHISPEEAVQVHLDIKSQQSMAFHWGTFNLSDEGWDEPGRDLNTEMGKRNLQLTDFQAVANGTVFNENW